MILLIQNNFGNRQQSLLGIRALNIQYEKRERLPLTRWYLHVMLKGLSWQKIVVIISCELLLFLLR